MKFKKVSPSCQGSLGVTSYLIFKILKALFTEKEVCALVPSSSSSRPHMLPLWSNNVSQLYPVTYDALDIQPCVGYESAPHHWTVDSLRTARYITQCFMYMLHLRTQKVWRVCYRLDTKGAKTIKAWFHGPYSQVWTNTPKKRPLPLKKKKSKPASLRLAVEGAYPCGEESLSWALLLWNKRPISALSSSHCWLLSPPRYAWEAPWLQIFSVDTLVFV